MYQIPALNWSVGGGGEDGQAAAEDADAFAVCMAEIGCRRRD